MSLRFKKPLFIASASCLTALTSITPVISLTSCDDEIGEQKDEADVMTGISSVTYNTMKKEFRSKYISHLKNDEFLSDDEIKERLVEFDHYLGTFDDSLVARDGKPSPSDYTSATMALSEVASTKFGFRLNRKCTTKWSDFTNEYQGLRQSTYSYLENTHTPPDQIDAILRDGDKRFDELIKRVSKDYYYDPLLGITKSQTDLLDVFQENNAEAAFVSAMNRLSDFTSRFSFKYDNNSGLYYEDLAEEMTLGDPIEPELFNEIFNGYNLQTDDPIDFRNDMLPGYIITPYLSSWFEDPISNQYAMEIDWEIFPEVYQRKPELLKYKDLVTAHIYGENQDIINGTYDPEKTINEIIQSSEHVTTKYYVKASSNYEKEAIKITYFDETKDEHITFKWVGGAQNNKNKYECFYDGIPEAKQGEKEHGTIDEVSLGNSGLRISCNDVLFEDLTSVIDKMDKERADPDNATPDELLTLSEKFIKYCSLKSDVTIDDPDEHNVSHIFKYQYLNSEYGDKSVLSEKTERKSNGFLVSEKFFTVANEKFNDAYSLFKRYKDNEFYEIKQHCNDLEASFVSTSAFTGVQIAVNVLKMFFLFDLSWKVIAIYNITLLTVNAIFLGIMWPLYLMDLVKPIDRFIAKVQNVRHSECFEQMQSRLSKDKKYFCVKDENGKYPTREYDKKKEFFRSANFTEITRPLFQYYSTIMVQEDFKAFKDLTVANEIDPKSFKKQFGTWEYTGYCYICNYGYCGLRMLVSWIVSPENESPWQLTVAEFIIETLLGMRFTKMLQETAFKFEY